MRLSNIACGGLLVQLFGLACGASTLKRATPEGGTTSVELDANRGSGAVPHDADGFLLPDAGSVVTPADAVPACVNLRCQQPACPGSASTTVSGTVYAPNGTLPLYNVTVYVPNAPLEPLSAGMSCDRCGVLASGRPIVSALSDHEGKFKISNVPVGKNIPLVIQVGKWRRQVVIPDVKACQDNPLTDPEMTRLPRNRGEGDLPRVALTSGRCDQLTCMIPKLGVDPAEMGVAGQDRAFTFFSGADGDTTGGPPGMTPATTLWNAFDELAKYSLVLLSCPCSEARPARGPAALDAVTRYVNGGGRVFGSHFEYIWLRDSPDAQLSGAFEIHAGDLGAAPVTLDTSFPKGKALADWMKYLDPALTYGRVPTDAILDDISTARPPAQIWARSPGFGTASGVSPRFVTINTPAGAPMAEQCGRAALLDVHVTAPSMGLPGRPAPNAPPFPKMCEGGLTKSEHVLAFLLFDLAACLQPDMTPPLPPPIVVD